MSSVRLDIAFTKCSKISSGKSEVQLADPYQIVGYLGLSYFLGFEMTSSQYYSLHTSYTLRLFVYPSSHVINLLIRPHLMLVFNPLPIKV